MDKKQFINLGGYITEVLDHSVVGSIDKNFVSERYLDPPGIKNGKSINPLQFYQDFKISWEGS